MTKSALFYVFLGLFFHGCATSPTGRHQLLLVGDGQMNSMGTQAFSEMKSKQAIEHDPAVNAYVKCVAGAVAREASDKTGVKDWEIVVFRDPSANAFALPGGKIGVHTGILSVANTADQLGAVLGHEVGHVIARHGNERVSQAMAAQGGLAIASVATSGSKDQATLMAALGLGTQFGVLLPHGRKQESEADLIGLDLMARAGFNPEQSVELWRNMAKASGGKQPPQWLSTHPSNEKRMEDLTAHMASARTTYQSAMAAGRRPSCSKP